MNFIKSLFKNTTNKILLGVLIIGFVISVSPFIIAGEQCPSGYTQQQVDSSGCIVGADIGSGMISMLGLFVAATALFGIFLSILSRLSSLPGKLAFIAFIIGLFMVVVGITTAKQTNEATVLRLYGCVPTGFSREWHKYCGNPKRAPEAEINYINNTVMIGAVSFLGGSLYAVSAIKRNKT